MRKRQKILAILLLVILCVVTACTDKDTVEKNDKNDLTQEDWGSFTPDITYSYDNKYYAVQKVEKGEPFDMIKVSIYLTETKEYVSEFYPARAWDFWGICWENDTYNIWIQSSDIGIFCYRYDGKEWILDRDAVRPDSIISKYDKPEEPLEEVPAEGIVPEEPKTELTAEVYSIDRQIELFAAQVEEWATFKGVWDKPELKDCWFTLTDLDYDGKLDLIVTSQAGSGRYSDNYIYEIDEHGKVTEREVDWGRSDSEPDILVDEMLVYRVSSSEEIRDYYIMDDYIKDGAMYYYQDIRVMCMMDDYLTAKILVRSENYYDAEKDEIIMTCEDADGNSITEDEYWNAADNYFAGLDYQKKTATFAWKHIEDLQGLTEEEVAQVLRKSYEGFSVKEPRPELTEENIAAIP